LQRAIIEKKRILAERFPRHVPKAIDDKLRARFGEMIKLPRGNMGG
jgi:trimethylamine--corrinoid protein Co-methyltransferase